MLRTLMSRAIVHPLLLAAFPVLFLYSHNADLALPEEAAWPLLASVLSAGVLWALLLPLFRNAQAAALEASLVLLLFHSYGRAFILLEGVALGPLVIGRTRFLLPFWVLLLAAGSYLIFKYRGRPLLPALTRAANTFSGILVAMAMVQIAIFQLGRKPADGNGTGGTAAAESALPDPGKAGTPKDREFPDVRRPDIYYIVPDSYVADSTLKNSFGHDNAPFTDYLKGKGFFVASQSRSNYAFTAMSLPATMNMELLTGLGEKLGPDSQDKTPLGRMMEGNKVMGFLKERGYTIINAGSWWGPTFANRDADVNFRSSLFNEFTLKLMESTALYPFMEEFTSQDLRWKLLNTFERLKEVPAIEEPTFTFVHVICPHPPFVFGPRGEKVKTVRRMMAKTDPYPLYVDQVEFVNSKLREAIDTLLARSATPPIIIIQADHGAAYIRKPMGHVDRLPDERYLKDQMRIFSAYLLPGQDGAVYDSITPVNTFRTVFNAYFDAGLPLLEDRSYYSTHSRPYDFTDVTEIVRYRGSPDSALHAERIPENAPASRRN